MTLIVNCQLSIVNCQFFKLLCVFLLVSFYGFSQTVWDAEIPVVEKSDYYNIELNQELVGAGLGYIKIFDDMDSETPYFIRSANPVQEINSFENYDLAKKTILDSLNIIIVDNRNSEYISRFCVVLQKAEIEKFVTVRGSSDMKQWYIVKQTSKVGQQGVNNNMEMLIIDFPQGNYRYYEITLWGNNSSPLDIQKVGKIRNSSLYGNFIEIDYGSFTLENNSEDKRTYIHFPGLRHTYIINKIEFSIKNKPDYLRRAVIKDSTAYNVESLLLSSMKDNSFFTGDLSFSSDKFISIENQNNPPLSVDSIKIYGLRRYACLYLEAGKKYRLKSDSRDHVFSKYDIEHFRDKISADLPLLSLTNLNVQFIPEEVAPLRELSLIEKPVFLWSIILITGAFLIFICLRMVKEMKK
jgi:hypothetical protein